MYLIAETILSELLSLGFFEDGSTKKVYRLSHPALSHLVHIKKPDESKKLVLAIPLQYESKLEAAKAIPVHGGVVGRSSNYKGYTPAGASSNPALTFDFETKAQLHQFINLMFGLQTKASSTAPNLNTQVQITESQALTKVRVGQDKFREALQNYWGGCSVTGYNHIEHLKASHIIPWAIDESARLDPFNGLLLTPNLDTLFDKGDISFDDNGLIIINPKLSDADCKLLGLHSSMKLRQVDEQHRKFLHWHRTAYQL